jgi:hypothetical protein
MLLLTEMTKVGYAFVCLERFWVAVDHLGVYHSKIASHMSPFCGNPVCR